MKTKRYISNRKNDYLEIGVSQQQVEAGWEQLLTQLEEEKSVVKYQWRYAFATMVVLLFAGTSIIYAKAQKAQPGEPLYNLKTLTQKAKVTFGSSPVLPTATPVSQGIKDSIKSELETPVPENPENSDQTATASGTTGRTESKEAEERNEIDRKSEPGSEKQENNSQTNDNNQEEHRGMNFFEENIVKPQKKFFEQIEKHWQNGFSQKGLNRHKE